MAISRQVCPFHGDEDILGIATGGQDGSLTFTCPRGSGHPQPGPHSWLYVPQPEGLPGIDGYAAELGLASELPAAIGEYRGTWIEYGVVERAYAMRCRDDFAAIVARYGHKAITPKRYTASAFLAGVLGVLSLAGDGAVPPWPRHRPLVIQRKDQLVGGRPRARVELGPPVMGRGRREYRLRSWRARTATRLRPLVPLRQRMFRGLRRRPSALAGREDANRQ